MLEERVRRTGKPVETPPKSKQPVSFYSEILLNILIVPKRVQRSHLN